MKTMLLKNAKIKSLKTNQVIFIGEKAGYIQILKYNITSRIFEELKKLDQNRLYNIWRNDKDLILKLLAAETWEDLNKYNHETIKNYINF